MTAIAALICAFSMTSCKGEPGAPGLDGVGVIKTVLINVPQSKWAYSGQDNNNYFYATVDMPEITSAVFDKGLVKMYRTYNFDKTNASQLEMPYVRPVEGYNESADEWYFYTETVDYEFGIGTMTICYTVSDFDYEIDEEFVPEAMQFRCVVMY